MIVARKYIGQVTNNTDVEFKGRVQVNIPELFHDDIPLPDLPWASQDREMSSNIPDVDEYVWVWRHDETHHRNWFYGNKVSLREYNLHFKDAEIKLKIALLASQYPDLKYQYYENGIIIGVSSSKTMPEIFIIHPSGSYIYFDPIGDISVNGVTGIVIPSIGSKGGFYAFDNDPMTGIPVRGNTIR